MMMEQAQNKVNLKSPADGLARLTVDALAADVEGRGRADKARRLCAELADKFVHPGLELESHTQASRAAGTGEFRWTRMAALVGGGLKVMQPAPCGLCAGVLAGGFLFNALAVLDERRDLLRRVVADADERADCAYQVWVAREGRWTEQVVDDLVPVEETADGRLRVASTVSGRDELWPSLLEKAYAQAMGGLDKVQVGSAVQALRDLTGAAYSTFKDTQDADLLWQRLLAALEKRWVALAGCQTTAGVAAGLWPDDLYQVVAVRTVRRTAAEPESRLAQVKDHRGTARWTGRWSELAPEWTPELRGQCALRPDAFWIAVEDLAKLASSLAVLMTNDHHHSSAVLEQPSHGPTVALFELSADTDLVVAVDQPDPRLATPETESTYCRVTVARLSPQPAQVQFVDCRLSAQRSIFVSDMLPAGKYAVVAQGYWPAETAERRLTVSVAADRSVRVAAPPVSAAAATQLEYWLWNNFAANNRAAFEPKASRLADSGLAA
jgi:hypothetical protein